MDNHTSFNHSPVEGHLGYFQVFAITNKDAMSICVQVLCFYFSGIKCPRVQFLGCILSTYLVL